MVGAAGLASSFAGFGPPRGTGDASTSSSSRSGGAPPLVRRLSLAPDAPVRGAFQHCALFKNILVAADGDASARLRVVDVRDWTEKQTIRVGAASERGADADAAADDDDETNAKTIPAAVSALVFDGTTIVAATHEGFVHTWRLMARGEKRRYARLLQPLRVDGVPVTKARILGEPGSKLLVCHAPSKRAFVVWELDTGKLKGAFSTDGVAQGVPLLLVESCGTVLACVHADADEGDPNEDDSRKRNAIPPRAPLAALLDARTGEGGALRDSAVLTNKGTPKCSAFDGELFVVATSLGVVVTWNLRTGNAPASSAHAAGAAAAVAAVALVPSPSTDVSARVLSGGADGALLLWDEALRPLARLDLGSPVTCLAAPGPRLAVAGTQDGFVEAVALPTPEADETPDAALAEARRATSFTAAVPRARYALRHDPGSAASSHASFDAFTRRVPVWEGAYVASGEAAGSDAPGETGGSRRGKNASGFSSSRALAGSGSGRTRSEEAARREAEEKEARTNQRAMDGTGVARDPNVRATADVARACSNPTCVAREDASVPGRKMLRCSRCKSAFYCSTHCQRTHWRDGHRRACVAHVPATAPTTTETVGATRRDASLSNDTRAARGAVEGREASRWDGISEAGLEPLDEHDLLYELDRRETRRIAG